MPITRKEPLAPIVAMKGVNTIGGTTDHLDGDWRWDRHVEIFALI